MMSFKPVWPSLLTTMYISTLLLTLFGIIMVFSSSIDYAVDSNLDSTHYLVRHLFFLVIGCAVSIVVLKTPSERLFGLSVLALAVSIILLVLVLVPGIGKTVNGSTRWINLGPINLQASEFAKLGLIIYIAGYLARKVEEVRQSWWGFFKPLLVFLVCALLLLSEPDFGALVVVLTAVLGMIFLSGVKLSHFSLLILLTLAALALLAVAEPYRLARLTSYTDPWVDQYDSGYQLTQALIAFGRGEWFGVGLGNSVQKLSYLPEAHTDFVFAVTAEEFGLIGALLLLLTFAALVVSGLRVGRKAERLERLFQAYLAYGIAILVGIQVLVNLGVNTGLLPTKGLALPFISYGGSSLVGSLLAVALLVRIETESLRLLATDGGNNAAKAEQSARMPRRPRGRSPEVQHAS
ncbi:putative lipid II flippase FtsW [Allohahella sp. A8]|uniref:putative lipid II flippase FtsW n=1 Tax=Allohahella sp. A8 TaxID=3141461 RepID=UPI000C09367B|nr:putative lipid II flippase FtsW [Hahellaceae bacterium]|tara:strand:+ start:20512 stop:21732 length:1221 start_codon:yes stop_codon:yes gene_type:complete